MDFDSIIKSHFVRLSRESAIIKLVAGKFFELQVFSVAKVGYQSKSLPISSIKVEFEVKHNFNFNSLLFLRAETLTQK